MSNRFSRSQSARAKVHRFALRPVQSSAELLIQARAECEELKRRLALVPRATQDAAVQISELEKALLSIRQARDATLCQIHALTSKLQAAETRIDDLLLQQADIQETADLYQATLEATERECAELRGLLEAKERHHAEAISELESRLIQNESRTPEGGVEKRLNEQLAAALAKVASLETYFEQVQTQQKQTNAKLIEKAIKAERQGRAAEKASALMKQQWAGVLAEQETLRSQLTEKAAYIAKLESEISRRSAGADQSVELERQRQEIEELTANLDAARDEARLAWSVTNSPKQQADEVDEFHVAAPDDRVPEPLDAEEARVLLTQLNDTLGVTAAAADPRELLDIFKTQLKEFAQRSLCGGAVSTYRIMAVCSEAAQWMQNSPAKIAALHGPISETFELLAQIAASHESAVHADTTGAAVYVVDDDVDNCECIAMSLDKIGLRTHYASKAEMAVEHLIAHTCDLIVLDVDLGTTNGFDLHDRIRLIPHHADTPILFVSGLNSAQARVAEFATNKDAFLAKPYNLHGLGLNALRMIVNSRLCGFTREGSEGISISPVAGRSQYSWFASPGKPAA